METNYSFSIEDNDTLLLLKKEADKSPRKRALKKMHSSHDEELHTMINVLKKGTYIQPHNHFIKTNVGKTIRKGESFLAIEGKGKIILFDNNGEILKVILMNAEEKTMVWVSAEQFHTIVALSEYFIIFENKTGPWKENEDKFFHAKFPDENESHEELIKHWEEL
ncbi:MAG: cupin fold metalloprotein, WbuC family [Bacteroidia bacterium]|nr:cupin fold metalloprotein, WbuC family [Bacteroidia bacterium]